MTKDQESKDIKEDAKSNNSIAQLKNNTKQDNKNPKVVIIDFAEPSYNHPAQETPLENNSFRTGNLRIEKSKENSFRKVLVEESKTQFGFFKQHEPSMKSGEIFNRKFSS